MIRFVRVEVEIDDPSAEGVVGWKLISLCLVFQLLFPVKALELVARVRRVVEEVGTPEIVG